MDARVAAVNALAQLPLGRGPWTATSLHAGPAASHLPFNEGRVCPRKTGTLITWADLAFFGGADSQGQGEQGNPSVA